MYQGGYNDDVGYGPAAMGQDNLYDVPPMADGGFGYGAVGVMGEPDPYSNMPNDGAMAGQAGLGAEDGNGFGSARSLSNASQANGRSQSRQSIHRSGSRSGSKAGLARTGSIYRGNSVRDTQASISMRGGISTHDMTKVYTAYGDMARRTNVSMIHGLKAGRSYRGDIADGDDVGKPRRVTTRQNANGHSTGYGGMRFRRNVALLRGDDWGHINRRITEIEEEPIENRDIPEPEMPMMPPMMMMPMEDLGPQQMPQVYAREEVRTYSNLSDMYQ